MHQLLLIFRKDTRHLWPYILLSLSITVLFVAIEPVRWNLTVSSAGSPGFLRLDLHHLQMLALTTAVLLTVSWLILIARAVHEENLVGNRQFWITRPYKWQCLLAAKALFIIVYISVPLTLAQIALLHRAGFAPSLFLENLACSIFLLTLHIALPLFALAAVTSSILRIVGIFVTLGTVLVVGAFFASSAPGPLSPFVPYGPYLGELLVLLLCLAALLEQYSSRNLWLSRSLLIALFLSIVFLAASPFDPLLVKVLYKQPDRTTPDLTDSIPASAGDGLRTWTPNPSQVSLHIPVRVLGIPQGTTFVKDHARSMSTRTLSSKHKMAG